MRSAELINRKPVDRMTVPVEEALESIGIRTDRFPSAPRVIRRGVQIKIGRQDIVRVELITHQVQLAYGTDLIRALLRTVPVRPRTAGHRIRPSRQIS